MAWINGIAYYLAGSIVAFALYGIDSAYSLFGLLGIVIVAVAVIIGSGIMVSIVQSVKPEGDYHVDMACGLFVWGSGLYILAGLYQIVTNITNISVIITQIQLIFVLSIALAWNWYAYEDVDKPEEDDSESTPTQLKDRDIISQRQRDGDKIVGGGQIHQVSNLNRGDEIFKLE